MVDLVDSVRLTPGEEAQARSYSYTLFGRLLLEGITADLLPTIRAIPELADLLPDPIDLEETAAAHHRLFAFNVFPYAGIFLEDSGLLGGPIAGEVKGIYQKAGFETDTAGADPDHLGQEMAFLAYLTGAEARAWQNDQLPAVSAWQAAQYHFLETHLLSWLIPCLITIQQQEDNFYRRLAQIILALAAGHYQTLVETDSILADEPASIPIPLESSTAGMFPPLEDGQTGLREIARFLITPVQAGLFLSRHDLDLLARRLSLPHGFGSREQMLLNLLRTAGQYDSALALFQALQAHINCWQEIYRSVQKDFPQTAVFVHPWQNRTEQAQQLLIQMQNRL